VARVQSCVSVNIDEPEHMPAAHTETVQSALWVPPVTLQSPSGQVQAPNAPHTGTSHCASVVSRSQPAVSVSMTGVPSPQVPPEQTCGVQVRVREPVLMQASA
jgi:hypothetical protein